MIITQDKTAFVMHGYNINPYDTLCREIQQVTIHSGISFYVFPKHKLIKASNVIWKVCFTQF